MYTIKVNDDSFNNQKIITDNIKYVITNVEGLSPANATINTTVLGLAPGEVFNSSRIEKRNIVITIYIISDIDATRQSLYETFVAGEKLSFEFSNENRQASIDGYVEKIECNPFEQKQKMQISIICTSPFFNSETITETVSTGDVITNNGMKTGVKMTLTPSGTITNPKIQIKNTTMFLKITTASPLIITTIDGDKHIYQNDEEIFPFAARCKWPQLEHGDNLIYFNADSGSFSLSIEYVKLLAGL